MKNYCNMNCWIEHCNTSVPSCLVLMDTLADSWNYLQVDNCNIVWSAVDRHVFNRQKCIQHSARMSVVLLRTVKFISIEPSAGHIKQFSWPRLSQSWYKPTNTSGMKWLITNKWSSKICMQRLQKVGGGDFLPPTMQALYLRPKRIPSWRLFRDLRCRQSRR